MRSKVTCRNQRKTPLKNSRKLEPESIQAKKPPTNLFNPHLLRHPAGAALGAAALGAAALGALGAGAGGTGAATRAAATGGAAGVGTGGAAGSGTDLSTGGAPVCGKPRRAAAS